MKITFLTLQLSLLCSLASAQSQPRRAPTDPCEQFARMRILREAQGDWNEYLRRIGRGTVAGAAAGTLLGGAGAVNTINSIPRPPTALVLPALPSATQLSPSQIDSDEILTSLLQPPPQTFLPSAGRLYKL